MSEAPSCTQLDGQHVELLPTCTVLSLFSAASAASGGRGGNGGRGLNLININLVGEPTNTPVTAGAAKRRQYRRCGGPAVS
jgi:hypothetical protein